MGTPADKGYLVSSDAFYTDSDSLRFATQDPTVYIEYLELGFDSLGNPVTMQTYLDYYETIKSKLLEAQIEVYVPEIVDWDCEGGWVAFGIPEGLYTLDSVTHSFPEGMDGRDLAWIMNRLIRIRSVAEAPADFSFENILIQPEEHGVVLIGWKYFDSSIGRINRVSEELLNLKRIMEKCLKRTEFAQRQIDFLTRFAEYSKGLMKEETNEYKKLESEYKLRLKTLYGPPQYRELIIEKALSEEYLKKESIKLIKSQ